MSDNIRLSKLATFTGTTIPSGEASRGYAYCYEPSFAGIPYSQLQGFGNPLTGAFHKRSSNPFFNNPPQGVPMTKTTITVTGGAEGGFYKTFDGASAEADALEYAQSEAHRSNATVYLTRVYKMVKPKRDVTIEEV